jgi:hypothetical protein
MLPFLQTVTDLLKKAYKQISILLNKKHNAVMLLVGPTKSCHPGQQNEIMSVNAT